MMLPVTLVSTWDKACGIAEYGWYLKETIERADPEIRILPWPDLDPARLPTVNRLVHLNYHRALHSRWTPEWVNQWGERGMRFIITWHDSWGENPPDDLSRELHDLAEAFIVHEPCIGLPRARYWRQGVPDWQPPEIFDLTSTSWCGIRPVLGTIGFPFPWKLYQELAKVTRRAGWALLLLAPTATPEQVTIWQSMNPHVRVETGFTHRDRAVSLLTGCDATAFVNVCANSGTSGAIRQGFAARKPVIAFYTCRQYRDIYLDPIGKNVVRWCETLEDVYRSLLTCPIQRIDPGIVAFAEQDSWASLGARYAELYRSLIT